MLTTQQLQSLSDLHIVTGIPLLLFDAQGNEIEVLPNTFGTLLTRSFLCEVANRCAENTLDISWDGLYHCIAVPLLKGIFLMTAPASIMAHYPGVLFHATADWVRPERRMDFFRFVSEVPSMGQFQLLKLVQLCRKVCNLPALDKNRTWFRSVPQSVHNHQPYEEQDRTSTQMHSAFYEPHVIDSIKSGDLEQLRNSYNRPIDGYIGRMSLNDLQQARYYFVCFMFLASRAAADGGVPREVCMQLSDQYCQMMDSISQIDGIFDLLWKALTDFCRRVGECKEQAGYAPSTRQCIAYVEQHLYDPIRMENLVDFCQLNRRSISQYFVQDLGMTIPYYINQRRMKEAATLLIETNLSLGQFSHLLQYSGQSYLGKLFLQKYGMTPLQYRVSHR